MLAEADRYIPWPGQVLFYKMEEIKIRELMFEKNFNLLAFYNAVLASGALVDAGKQVDRLTDRLRT